MSQPVDTNDVATNQLVMVAFIYSTTPTATGVFVYCAQYGMKPDSTAVAMVLCTLCSAPIMFVSASMVTVSYSDISTASAVLPEVRSIFGVLSFIGALWVLITCAWTMRKDYFADFSRSTMQGFVMAIAISCLVSTLPDFYCFADVTYGNNVTQTSNATKQASLPGSPLLDLFLGYGLHNFGYTSVRCWVTAMALWDAFAYRLHGRELYKIVHKYRYLTHGIVWSLGLAIAASLGIYAFVKGSTFSCAIGYIPGEGAVFLATLGLTIVINIVCLSLLARRLGILKQQALQRDKPSSPAAQDTGRGSSGVIPLVNIARKSSFYVDFTTDLSNNGVYLRFLLVVVSTLSAIIAIILTVWETFFDSNITTAMHLALVVLDNAMFHMIGILLCVVFALRADVLQPITDRVKAIIRMCKCKCPTLHDRQNLSATIIEDAQWTQQAFDTVETTCAEFLSAGMYDQLLAAVKESQCLDNSSVCTGQQSDREIMRNVVRSVSGTTPPDMNEIMSAGGDEDDSKCVVTGLFIAKWLKANWAEKCSTCMNTLTVCNTLLSGGIFQIATQGTDFLQSTHRFRGRSELAHLHKQTNSEEDPLPLAVDLSEQMQDAGLIKDRKWMTMSFSNVFVAKEGVDFLLSQKICRSRKRALEFMQKLVRHCMHTQRMANCSTVICMCLAW